MKVAFVVSGLNHISGISSSTSTIANSLVEDEKMDVTVISLVDRSNTQFVHLDPRIKVIKVYSENINLKLHVLQLIIKLRKIIKSENFTVVVVPVLIFSLLKVATLCIKKINLVAWDHASIPIEEKKFTWNYLNRHLAIKYSAKLIAITKGAKKVYQKRFKEANNIIQIYNTSNLEHNPQKIYNLKSKKIISAGALNQIKGFDLAIEVAALIFKENPEWQWHIFGDGREKKNLEIKIKQYGLESNLIIKGYSDQIEELYENYSFYVLPSRSESFGMVVLEAQINKLPVISFDSGFGPMELIDNNINGYLVESFNTKKMAQKVLNLMTDEKVRLQMSNNASYISKKFDRNTIVNEWKKLLKSIHE